MATTRLLLHLKLRKRPRNPGDSQREVHPSQLKLADVPTMPFTPAPSEPRPVYKTPITGVKTPHSQVEGDHPFNASITNDARPVIPPSTTETIQQKFIKGKTNYPSHSTSFSLSSSASFSSTSRLTQNDPFRIHNLGRGSVQVEQTFIRQRAWWLFGSEYIPLETRVFINRQYGRDGIDGEKTMGGDGYAPSEDKSVLSSSRRHYERGISVSRLGWFDHWL
ncbi:hypothetical protein FRC17_001915 [Serendipita sp. 399]|nr:hypothetical protein FRC17_001915 [Serendipita sp. 399]